MKTEGTLLSFTPEMGFSHVYIDANLLFCDDQCISVCQVCLSKIIIIF